MTSTTNQIQNELSAIDLDAVVAGSATAPVPHAPAIGKPPADSLLVVIAIIAILIG